MRRPLAPRGDPQDLISPDDFRPAIRLVADDYIAFLRHGAPPGTHSDAKAFTARHVAGKAALAHLEQLVKLARAVGATGPDDLHAATMLAEARGALAVITHDEEPNDDDGPPA